MDDDWDDFGDFVPTPTSQNSKTGNTRGTSASRKDNAASKPTSSRPTSSLSSTKVKRPKTPGKEQNSSDDWADDEFSWNGKAASKPAVSRPASSSNKNKGAGGASVGNRPKTSAETIDQNAEWGDDEADVRPKSSGNMSVAERTAKSPRPKPPENGWLDESMSRSTVDILREADMLLIDTETAETPPRSGSAADKKGRSGSASSAAAGSRAELKSRQSSRAGSRPASRSRSRTSLRPDSSHSRALSPRPNRIAPAEVHVVDERPEVGGKSPSASPRDGKTSRPTSRSSPRRTDDRAASATSQSSRFSKRGVFGKIVDSFGRNTSVTSLRAAAPGESVSNPRTPSTNMARRPSTGMSGLSAVSSSSGCSSASQRSEQAEVHFEVPLDKKYECPVCQHVLRYPVQFQECGHHVCSQCVPELVRTSGACPIDNKTISRDQAYPNKTLQQEIAALAVRCANAGRGCNWKGRFDEHQSHDESCEHTTAACPNGCGADIQKRFLQSHVTNDCPKRGTACDFCGENVQQEEEIEHLKECRMFPMSCPNGCDAKELPREEIVTHTAEDCPKAFISCPFEGAGCDFEARRENMLTHMEGSIAEHLEKVGRLTIEHQERMQIHAKEVINCSAIVHEMEQGGGLLNNVNGCQLLWKITNYADKVADAKAGRRVSLYSPIFLTSRYGYKMAISICPNGDGQGKGKFMSLFMCIIRGEFDALLPWPFSQKVTIMIIDQCQDPAARKNLEYVMKPNTCKDNLQFLGRPVHERNPSFGTQMFCPLPQLSRGDYIRDNTMFISVQVDNSGMPSIP